MDILVVSALLLLTASALAYRNASLKAWTAALGCLLLGATLTTGGPWLPLWFAWGALAVLCLGPVRRSLVSSPALAVFRRGLPTMSDTEREALEAGTVWWDAELFSGRPRWPELLDCPSVGISDEERAFLDGPTNTLCGMLDDWEINFERRDLPSQVWRYVREQGFLGLIIPKRYGGKAFSVQAHSMIVERIASRSLAAAVTVMVPNSLGPAELLIRYGTEQQRGYWLPRLADGREIPCFALTGPHAGSDASSIPDIGVVCYGNHDGQRVLGLRLSWEKRYITLAPVATVLGLAFHAVDPDGLLGDKQDLGITLALVPTDHNGVQIGRRHYPAAQAFLNGPTTGNDVFIPLDWVVGEEEGIGRGWVMLMNCLAAGRAISLPALSSAAVKLAARLTGAYARVRRQFKVPIGRFEGVEEALTRIAAFAYQVEAARGVTCAALDRGEEPAVISAMLKYRATEGMRQVICDAMDIHGGRGICLGPSNYLFNAYQSSPIAITVEGANILTRSLIVFGQGAIRCHPWLLREMAAAQLSDRRAAVEAFDEALSGHINHIVGNVARAAVLNCTGGRLAASPRPGRTADAYRQMARASANFALLSDAVLLLFGGALKFREKMSGRFADILSELYLMSCALRRFEADGRPPEDQPVLDWLLASGHYRIQRWTDEVLSNLPSRTAAWCLRRVLFPYGRTRRAPDDALGHKVAALLLEPSAARDRLTQSIYRPTEHDDPVGRVEHALEMTLAADLIEAKMSAAREEGKLETGLDAGRDALKAGIITKEESETLREAKRAVRAAVDVDDFHSSELSPKPTSKRNGIASVA